MTAPGIVQRQTPYDVSMSQSRPPTGVGSGQADRAFDTRALSIDNPYKEPPPDAVYFTDIGQASLAAAVGAFSSVVLRTLPDNFVGVIRSLTFFVNDMLDTSVVDFGVRVNSSTIPGFEASRIFPRNATSVSRSYDLIYRLPTGAVIEGIWTNQAAAAQTVGLQIFGWFFPQDVAIRYDAERA